ncbi:MAG: cadherin-like beta sandwich domain-containing protein, partial [Aphanocapsa feldmannii 277cV]
MEGEIINTLPTAADGSVEAEEDMAYPFAAADFNFSDLDNNDALDHVTIITLPTEGTLALNGVAVMAGDEVTKQSLDDDELTYAPPANVNGVDIASFTFKVNDGKDDSTDPYTISINVEEVNDAPTASSKTVIATEDTDYPFTATDFGFMDIDQGDTLNHVTITTVPGTGKGELLLDGAVIAMGDLDKDVTAGDLGDSKLKYRPPNNENGDNYASFSFTVNDGQDDSESAYSMNINMTAVNDPPIPVDDDAETPENTPVEIEVLANDEDVDEGTALSVTRVGTADGINTATETNPTNGTVTITGSGTTITYTPDSNFITGTDTFTYVVSDNATTPLTAVGTVTVTVISDASNARLSSLTMSTGTLEPDFSASTTSYTASVANNVDSISLTPTTERTGATVTVDGSEVSRGNASDPIPLAEGADTTIRVVVTPQDQNAEEKTYTIQVTRAASSNAALSDLQLSTGTLEPDFSAATISYTASVANDVESTTVTPTTANANATVTVDGREVSRGNASDPI